MKAGILVTLTLLAAVASTSAQIPNYDLSIENLCVDGGNLQFALYMQNNAGTGIFLETCDFIISFNDQFFCEPNVRLIRAGTERLDANYIIDVSAVTAGPGTKAIAVSVDPPNVSNEAEFSEQVQLIEPGDKIMIAYISVGAVCDENGTAGLTWLHEGLLRTSVYVFREEFPWNQTEITLGATYRQAEDVTLQPADCPDLGDQGDRVETFRIVPNPSNERFTLHFEDLNLAYSIVDIVIYDLNGGKIAEFHSRETNGEAVTSREILVPDGLASGSYQVEVRLNEGAKLIGTAMLIVVR